MPTSIVSQFRTRRIAGTPFVLFLLCLPFYATTAKADGVNVSIPSNNATVSAPFTVQADSATCTGQPVAAMGYSLDDSSKTTTYNSTSINALALASPGQHKLHVKSWGSLGASCTKEVMIDVSSASLLPPTVTAMSNLQQLKTWAGNHDSGTGGQASGSTNLTSSPSLSGIARRYSMNFRSNGGEIFYLAFDADTAATNFIYDAHIWLSTTEGLGNLEMDMNQVMANGQTVIYGIQCDGYSQTWDYTINTGTPTEPIDTWVHSNLGCNPQSWTPHAWHHVQIAYSRDAVGTVTYSSVSLDGVQSKFEGATGNSAFALGWSPTLLTNLQIDGRGAAGAIVAYLDNLTIYRW